MTITPTPWIARLTRADELHDGEEPYWLVLAADENANEGDALIASINTLDGADAHMIVRACNSFEELTKRNAEAADLIDELTGALAEVRKVRDDYASRMKFCDIEPLPYFRDFVARLNTALLKVQTP